MEREVFLKLTTESQHLLRVGVKENILITPEFPTEILVSKDVYQRYMIRVQEISST